MTAADPIVVKVDTLSQFGSVLAGDLDEAHAICRVAVSRGLLPGIRCALSWKTGVADYVVETGNGYPSDGLPDDL